MAWILTITVTYDEMEPAADRLWELGTSGIAVDGASMIAGFESQEAASAARDELGGSLTPVDPTVWETPEVTTIDIGGRSVTIDPGRSFGHGNHPTTRLCLGALEAHVHPGQRVLDVGCGSGVLSLAAKTLGAASVTAIDIDPVAVATTLANAARNQIDVDASTTAISDVRGRFDVVVANMLIAELEPIAGDIGRVADELIIISGALVDDRARVLESLAPWARLVDEAVAGEWLGATFRIENR